MPRGTEGRRKMVGTKHLHSLFPPPSHPLLSLSSSFSSSLLLFVFFHDVSRRRRRDAAAAPAAVLVERTNSRERGEGKSRVQATSIDFPPDARLLPWAPTHPPFFSFLLFSPLSLSLPVSPTFLSLQQRRWQKKKSSSPILKLQMDVL